MSAALSIPVQQATLADKVTDGVSQGVAAMTSRSASSLADSSAALAIDAGARVAGAVDWAVSLPRRAGDAVGSLHIPVASAVAPTVGAIFSGVFGFLAHGQTLGALKWLQTLRLWNGVERGLSDSLQGTDGVAPLTVKSFLACVSDDTLRGDLTSYFSALTRVKDLQKGGESSSQTLQEAHGQLAKLEMRIGRRAELLELQALVGAADAAQRASHAQLERLAEDMASKMISAVQGAYKKRLGFLGSEMQGQWVALAAQGESGREQLRVTLKDRLLSAYEAEQRGEATSLAGVRTALHDAFLTKATMREATFYSVLGVLMNTGAIPAVVDFAREHGGAVYDAAAAVARYLTPEWIREGVSAAVAYAKATLYTVLGYMGIKAGLAGTQLYRDLAPHQHVDSGAVRVDTGPAHGDAGSLHTDMSAPHVDSGASHLDAARADAAMALGDGVPRVDHSSAFSAAHGDASPGHAGGVHVDVARPHVETRVDLGGARVEPGAIHPRVHIK